jgi:hypothetical protein
MARRSGKGKVGRPAIEFDLEIVEGLGRIGATAPEMAHVLPASQSTIEHRLADPETDFSKAYRKGQALLKASLRRKQIAVAMTGNVTMLIWLGKQHLAQQDKVIETRRSMGDLLAEQIGGIEIHSPEDAKRLLRAAGVKC